MTSPTTRVPPYGLEIALRFSRSAGMAVIIWTHYPQGVRTTSRTRLQRVVLGLDDLRGISEAEQILGVLDALSQALAEQAAERHRRPPEGDHRGGETQVPGQQSLNLDLSQ